MVAGITGKEEEGTAADEPQMVHFHEWTDALAEHSLQQPCVADEPNGLVACGDYCLGGRVEGAALSGVAAAEAVKKILAGGGGAAK
eukprot:CAMPEP_0170188450 /NCGR_PEP_ID=MMETSP0040_2-20121228/44372_1 /TAXON_ID=641309 /ORGANISM="Lotharella oceanica, Strain CCMP622" /LENGTH=85 /DNA_ID=CAMNT_0010435759 /DNA_START=3 /DNA_END=260 /DNA_ORIENTATION=-